jgi:16S rRNA (guanine527-N7)-methyltransferase
MQKLKLFLEKELNISSVKIIEQFKEYERLLLDWNKKINLVSRNTVSIENHILNSIFFLTKFSFKEDSKLIDIGTGGGFPGIPLKILFPSLNITLLDSIGKKIKVLENIISKLELEKINALGGRAEDISKQKEFKNNYNYAVSKSVSSLSDLWKWSKDFLKVDGMMINIKGGDISKETNSLKKMYNNIKIDIINFQFSDIYGITDKKIVVINN